MYRDKGYFGVESRGYSATMRRGVRGHPLGIRDRLRNRRINRKRAPGERPFAVIKRVFNAGHVLVTTVPRVRVKSVRVFLLQSGSGGYAGGEVVA